ncbi:S24/S26 family peptidase [Jatrophihabitans sp. YIM 134969]
MPSVPARGPGETSGAPRERTLLPLQLITVRGPSMVPTLRPGDRLLVWRGGRARPGDVVLGTFADLPGRLVVKRLRALEPGGRALLASDNDAAGGDSRTHGPARVLGRVVLVQRGATIRRPAAAPAL